MWPCGTGIVEAVASTRQPRAAVLARRSRVVSVVQRKASTVPSEEASRTELDNKVTNTNDDL